MVKFYTQNVNYDYPFPTVTLAYFLRYPNPFSTHVLSTDVIERTFDAESQRLTTTRLHLKKSKLPSALLRILPKSLLGVSSQGESQSYILERSIVDAKEGWMRTESRNLDFTGVLSVVERQEYRPKSSAGRAPGAEARNPGDTFVFANDDSTAVKTTVQLTSRFGQRLRQQRRASEAAAEDEDGAKAGFFARWSSSSIQRSIEAIGLSRASKSQPNATEGMKIVLERLREGGLVRVLEGMRRDREEGLGFKTG